MKWHKVDKYIPLKTSVTTHKRGRRNVPSVFRLGELDGFYIDNELDRAVHITFEERDVIVVDIYNTAQAANKPVGNAIGIIELNLRTGRAKCFREGR